MDKLRLPIIILLFTGNLIILPAVVLAETEHTEEQSSKTNTLFDSMLDKLDFTEVEQYWDGIHDEYGAYLSETTRKSLLDLIKEDQTITLKSTVKGLIHFLLFEVIENGKLLGTLIVLTLFSVILQSIQNAFEKSSITKIANFVVYLVLLYLVMNSFQLVFTYAKTTIESMSNFLLALLPLMLGLIAAFGQVFTATFFQPITLFFIYVSGMLMTTFVFPLLYLSAMLVIVSNLNQKFQATHLAELLKTISLTTIALFLTIFLGVMSIQGTATAIQDGVALKATKFVTGNFIPVVGKTFTDAAETVLSVALVLKNAIGLAGMVIIILIAIFPIIKITVIAFVYKLAAALLQPLGNTLIVNCLNTVSKYIMYILASLVIVTFMFLIAIVIITAASNISILL